MQFTVNGQFQPELKIKPGQTEIWVVANISDIAYMPLRFTETATGNHPKFSIVGQDGNPYTQVQRPVDGDGTTLEHSAGVAVRDRGDDAEDRRPRPRHAAGAQAPRRSTNPGVLYTNNGTENSPAVLGTVTVDPQVHQLRRRLLHLPDPDPAARHAGHRGQGQTTAFEPGQNLDAYTSFVDTSVMTPDVKRALTISGGFGNEKASNNDPKAFTYQFDDNIFPNIPLIQPRLNSVEEWTITNFNNDAHPMHIHVNDFQVHGDRRPDRRDNDRGAAVGRRQRQRPRRR